MINNCIMIVHLFHLSSFKFVDMCIQWNNTVLIIITDHCTFTHGTIVRSNY